MLSNDSDSDEGLIAWSDLKTNTSIDDSEFQYQISYFF